MRYSIEALEFILSNYIELKTGKIPAEKIMVMRTRLNRSPYETAICWVSDLDRAMDVLSPRERPHLWLKVSQDCDEQNLRDVLHYLDYRQRRLVSYYILGIKEMDEDNPYYVSKHDLYINAMKSLFHLQRIINKKKINI